MALFSEFGFLGPELKTRARKRDPDFHKPQYQEASHCAPLASNQIKLRQVSVLAVLGSAYSRVRDSKCFGMKVLMVIQGSGLRAIQYVRFASFGEPGFGFWRAEPAGPTQRLKSCMREHVTRERSGVQGLGLRDS